MPWSPGTPEGPIASMHTLYSIESTIRTLNNDQLAAFIRVCESVEGEKGGLMHLDGPGGSGKTYLLNLIIAFCQIFNFKACVCSSSGISALLLDGGQTAHSAFGIPLKLSPDSVSNLSPNKQKYKQLAEVKLVIWDEISMQHKHAIECVDRLFREVHNNDKPFGGVVVLLSGDFCQILPIVPKGSLMDQVAACIKRASFWKDVIQFKLNTNLRLGTHGSDGHTMKSTAASLASQLMMIGEGIGQSKDTEMVNLDGFNVHASDSTLTVKKELVRFVYCDFAKTMRSGTSEQQATFLGSRAIITPLNVDVASINLMVLQTLVGSLHKSYSVDIVDEDLSLAVSEEVLHACNPNGFPPHELHLKVNCCLVLLRNLDIKRGLCNGTRLKVKRISPRVLLCTVLNGSRIGEEVLIPKIKLLHEGSESIGVNFYRYQFPVSLAFAMTINKAQGQGLDRVGLFLPNPVFSHGQMYVGLSRTKIQEGLIIGLVTNEIHAQTLNVVAHSGVRHG